MGSEELTRDELNIVLDKRQSEIEKLREMIAIYETTDAARSFTDEQASRMYQLENQ